MINFETLRKARERMDHSRDGQFGRCGNWKIALGGYDMGYEVYYKGEPVMRVNYELDEYEFYSCDYEDVMFTPDTVPQIKKALEITDRFDNVGDIDDVGDYIDHFGEYVNGVEANVSEGNKMKFKKIMTKEARLPVMWAVDFRDMHSAIHGLFYGKDRRMVERFAKRLEAIENDTETSPEEMKFVWDDLMSEFPDIKQIEEINYREIGKLPSGKYGIVIDDVEYRLVNNVAIDLYEESTKRNSKMKFKKIAKEGSKPDFKSLDKATWEIGRTPDGKRQNESDSDNSASDHPRIYVGTYAKYNNGSLDGKWIDISEYNTYEDFVDACRELHKDEKDPEFMVQDYENFPEKWYHEGGLPTEDEFNKITDYYLMDDTEKAAYEAYVNYTDDDDIDDFHEAYQGQFDSASDFAYNIIDDLGWDGIGQDNLDMYFDYDSFGRDLMYDFHMGDEDNEDSEGNPEDPDHYYDNDGYDMGEYESDDQVARDYIDSIGGVSQLGTDTMRNYFDYEAFGRDLFINDYFEEDGFVFRNL